MHCDSERLAFCGRRPITRLAGAGATWVVNFFSFYISALCFFFNVGVCTALISVLYCILYALHTACTIVIFLFPSFCYYVIFFPMYGSALLTKSYLYFTHYGSVLYFHVLPDCIELFYVFLRFSICVFALMYSFFQIYVRALLCWVC